MIKLASTLALGLALATGTAFAAEPTAQQSKMKTCNADAKTKNLAGEERKAFMSSCLSAKAEAPADGKTAQQQKNDHLQRRRENQGIERRRAQSLHERLPQRLTTVAGIAPAPTRLMNPPKPVGCSFGESITHVVGHQRIDTFIFQLHILN
jgi:hypothetical protein